MSLRVVIFTGTRAEFGLLQPIMRACEAHPALEPEWLASGIHLLPEYGNTIELVRADGAPLRAEVPYFVSGEAARDFGTGVAALAQALKEGERPRWLVVLGDRYETFAAVCAASMSGIPVAHLHGGDRANSGHIDESMRHAITRFASLHCAASQQSADRLRRFGEEEWRIHRVGAPGLDRLREFCALHQDAIAAWGTRHPKPLLLVIFHPVSTEVDQAGRQARYLFEALDQRPEHKFAIYPNNDPGSQDVLFELRRFEGARNWTVNPNLATLDYVGAMSHASAMVGNSSAGFIEAPFFSLPMLHVGNRNLDREHAGNVTFVDFDQAEMHRALQKVLDPAERARIAARPSPYGDGFASGRVASLLESFASHPDLLRKMVSY